MNLSISQMCVVDDGAQLGDNVSVGHFTTIADDVIIGDNTWIGPNVTIMSGARIGNNCRIFPGAVLSAIPQDLKFKGEYSNIDIGNNVTIRECVTINRGTEYSDTTRVGNNTMLMAYVHLAHDCIIGNNVILGNAVNVAGHVEINDHAIVSGMSAIHQFCKIGKHAFISGGSLVGKDVPPYVKAARNPLSYVGVNSVGLKRRGYTNDQIHHIQDIYRKLFVEDYNITQAINFIQSELEDTPERQEILDFIEQSDRGIMKGY
ncbi:MAG: acyl-ACP--UDP-N-acetylglucosamine O-acyltransferase [Saprospiraceae bacterium]|nr:acyl-ACP--UDP-N-acetylglucosamine O-acyltransferase [Saprospiraceae bacterium]